MCLKKYLFHDVGLFYCILPTICKGILLIQQNKLIKEAILELSYSKGVMDFSQIRGQSENRKQIEVHK